MRAFWKTPLIISKFVLVVSNSSKVSTRRTNLPPHQVLSRYFDLEDYAQPALTRRPRRSDSSLFPHHSHSVSLLHTGDELFDRACILFGDTFHCPRFCADVRVDHRVRYASKSTRIIKPPSNVDSRLQQTPRLCQPPCFESLTTGTVSLFQIRQPTIPL
jgi:hypothetical protein